MLREVRPSGNDRALVIENPDALARIVRRESLLRHRGDNQIGDACACRACADEKETLIPQLAAGDLKGAEQSGEDHAGGALNVVVVATDLVAVTREQVDRV